MRNFLLFSLLFSAFCCLLCAPSLLAAQSSSADSLTANPVFQNNCAKCHGKSAGGRFMAGPSLVSEKVTSAAADGLRDVITNGKGRMPKFSGKLSPAEIDTLVQQIKSAGKK